MALRINDAIDIDIADISEADKRSVRSLKSSLSFSVMLRLAARADGNPVNPDE